MKHPNECGFPAISPWSDTLKSSAELLLIVNFSCSAAFSGSNEAAINAKQIEMSGFTATIYPETKNECWYQALSTHYEGERRTQPTIRITELGNRLDWDAMNRLYERGMILNPVSKAKSVVLTEEGEAEGCTVGAEIVR